MSTERQPKPRPRPRRTAENRERRRPAASGRGRRRAATSRLAPTLIVVVGLILAASAIGLALDRRSADATPKAETGAAQPAAKQPDAEAAAATAAAAEAERATESHRAKKACDSCHTAPAEHYPGKCTSCHSPERPFEQPQLSHVTFGAHTQATQACATCHAAEPTSEITCRACHGNDCSKNAKTVGDCLKCHKKGSTKTWVPKPES